MLNNLKYKRVVIIWKTEVGIATGWHSIDSTKNLNYSKIWSLRLYIFKDSKNRVLNSYIIKGNWWGGCIIGESLCTLTRILTIFTILYTHKNKVADLTPKYHVQYLL